MSFDNGKNANVSSKDPFKIYYNNSLTDCHFVAIGVYKLTKIIDIRHIFL